MNALVCTGCLTGGDELQRVAERQAGVHRKKARNKAFEPRRYLLPPPPLKKDNILITNNRTLGTEPWILGPKVLNPKNLGKP